MEITPYLQFNGDCNEAFAFYESCLGGKILMMMKAGESPMADQVPPAGRNAIIHARMSVGDTLLMGCDAMGGHYVAPAGFHVTIGMNDAEEADRVFHALSEGGSVNMPIQETFWAVRFGVLVDRFGTPWMINCEKPA